MPRGSGNLATLVARNSRIAGVLFALLLVLSKVGAVAANQASTVG